MLKRKKPLVRRSSLKLTAMRRATAKGPPRKTNAAEVLWSILRDQEVAGLRFRRQQTIGPFTADFVCPSAKLILKIERLRSTDDAELQWFRDSGYRVLQFQENAVLADPRCVTEAIARLNAFRIIARDD